MTSYLIAYGLAALIFFSLDLAWLGTVANRFYRTEIGHLLAPKPNLAIAAAFYLVFLVGVMIFAIAPELQGGGWQRAALFGGLFGFFSYATYDLTCLSTMRGFTARLAVVDIAWGTTLTAVSAAISVAATQAILAF